MKFKRFLCVILVASAVVLAWPMVMQACPTCSETIAANSSTGEGAPAGSLAGGIGGSMAAGYYYSILFMLVMLFSVLAAMSRVIVREVRAHAQMTRPESGASN